MRINELKIKINTKTQKEIVVDISRHVSVVQLHFFVWDLDLGKIAHCWGVWWPLDVADKKVDVQCLKMKQELSEKLKHNLDNY